MLKRILCAGLVLIMAFCFVACVNNIDPGDSELAEYKTQAKSDLQDYALAKAQENYSAANWEAILDAADAGKAAIEDATTKLAVTTAFNDAKGVIDTVEEDEMKSIDFTLVLGRMDYGWALGFETIVGSFSEWLALYPITDLPELSDKFDEQFFEDRTLIVFALGRIHKGAQFEKVEVFGQNNELLVKVYDNGSSSPAEEFSTWIVVIEVQKSLIKGFSELRLETNFQFFNGVETNFYFNS